MNTPSEELRLVFASEPTLSPGAARALLQLLRDADQQSEEDPSERPAPRVAS